jgi:DNA-binding transcriptional regulator of glucitol operon
MAGSFLKGRIYTVIVIGEDDVIVNAEKLSGMTVFSTLKPVTELVGQNINDILDETKAFSITKKERESFIVAIQGMKK